MMYFLNLQLPQADKPLMMMALSARVLPFRPFGGAGAAQARRKKSPFVPLNGLDAESVDTANSASVSGTMPAPLFSDYIEAEFEDLLDQQMHPATRKALYARALTSPWIFKGRNVDMHV